MERMLINLKGILLSFCYMYLVMFKRNKTSDLQLISFVMMRPLVICRMLSSIFPLKNTTYHAGCHIGCHADAFQHCIIIFLGYTSLLRLNKEQRIEIILRAGSGSSRMVANVLSRKHGPNNTHYAVARLIVRLRQT